MTLPDPLTPPDCDLRDFAFMPLDTARLLDSDLFALATGDEFKAAITLWCKAWQQIPAGSLPNDERVLAHLAGAGAKWKKVRSMALRGFVECTDGRLYHPTICQKATDAWAKKQSFRERSRKGNEKRWGSQKDDRQRSHGDATVIPKGVLEPPKGEGEGQKKKEGSEANASGAAAPPADPSKVLFDAGVALLVKADVPARQARSLIAKWRRDRGEPWTREALVSAEGKGDPVSWIEARMAAAVGNEDEARAASHATAERYRRMAIPGPPVGAIAEVAA